MHVFARYSALLMLLGGPTLASAQFIEQTFDGTISGGNTIDTTGIFGAAGANLAGDSYTSTYLVNTTTASFNDSGFLSQYIGLASASIAINGVTYTMPTSPAPREDDITDIVKTFTSGTTAEFYETNGNALVDSMSSTFPNTGPLAYAFPEAVNVPFNHAFAPAAGDTAGGSFVDGALNLTLNEIFAERHDVVSFSAPEIDPASAASGFTLMLGSIMVIRGRRRSSRPKMIDAPV
jgi:hypothetical protein